MLLENPLSWWVSIPEQTLMAMGLNKNEVRVYLSLLRLGEATAAGITKHSRVHRTNVYDILQKLEEMGLVCHTQEEDTKTYSCTNPKNLQKMILTKQNQLEKVLPALEEEFQGAQTNVNTVHILRGAQAFTQVLQELLDYREEILVYGAPEELPSQMRFFLDHFHRERIDRNIPIKFIWSGNISRRVKQGLMNLEYTQFIQTTHSGQSNVSTTICKDEVVITRWTKRVKSIRIRDPHVANSYRELFYTIFHKK